MACTHFVDQSKVWHPMIVNACNYSCEWLENITTNNNGVSDLELPVIHILYTLFSVQCINIRPVALLDRLLWIGFKKTRN